MMRRPFPRYRLRRSPNAIARLVCLRSTSSPFPVKPLRRVLGNDQQHHVITRYSLNVRTLDFARGEEVH